MNRTDLEAGIRRLHAESFGWAMSCCDRSVADAEDVLQAAYMKILDGRAKFGERSRFRTWLFGVIRLTAQEQRRREERRTRLAEVHAESTTRETNPAATGDDAGAAILARIDDRAQARRLERAMRQLTERQREVLHLVFYQDMSVAEAAEIMDVSIGSARTHYDRGKKRLRNLLMEAAER